MSRATVRYIVESVEGAMPFYEALGFEVLMHPAPGFAAMEREGLRLLLNEPGAGGAGQAMPDGRSPHAGGWNRFQLPVADLEATVGRLKSQGIVFRSGIVVGNGGKQILAEDPSGNVVELFEPGRRDWGEDGQAAAGRGHGRAGEAAARWTLNSPERGRKRNEHSHPDHTASDSRHAMGDPDRIEGRLQRSDSRPRGDRAPGFGHLLKPVTRP